MLCTGAIRASGLGRPRDAWRHQADVPALSKPCAQRMRSERAMRGLCRCAWLYLVVPRPAYALEDEIPIHSVLSKARKLLGILQVFERLFTRSVEQCVACGAWSMATKLVSVMPLSSPNASATSHRGGRLRRR